MTSHRLPSQPADIALQRALELQVSALAPIAAGLQGAVAYPPIAPADWHGPASHAYDGLESRLRARLDVAERAVSDALLASRVALREVAG